MNESEFTFEGPIATWMMPATQGEYNGTYLGTFKFKCYLTPMQDLAASRKYAELLGANAMLASEHDARLAFSLSQLEQRINFAPPFWTSPTQNGEMPGSIPDLNIISLVLDKAILAQKIYKERVMKERDRLLNRTIEIAEDILVKESGQDEAK